MKRTLNRKTQNNIVTDIPRIFARNEWDIRKEERQPSSSPTLNFFLSSEAIGVLGMGKALLSFIIAYRLCRRISSLVIFMNTSCARSVHDIKTQCDRMGKEQNLKEHTTSMLLIIN